MARRTATRHIRPYLCEHAGSLFGKRSCKYFRLRDGRGAARPSASPLVRPDFAKPGPFDSSYAIKSADEAKLLKVSPFGRATEICTHYVSTSEAQDDTQDDLRER